MLDSSQQELIEEIAREAVSQLSPQELPLFRASSRAFFKDPEGIQTGGKDEMIGFGVGEAASMITPVVLAVTMDVVHSVSEQIKDTIKSEGGNLASDWLKLAFKRYRPGKTDAQELGSTPPQTNAKPEKTTPPLPAPLTAQQLTLVRQTALKKARKLGLSEARAALLADAITGGLAVA